MVGTRFTVLHFIVVIAIWEIDNLVDKYLYNDDYYTKNKSILYIILYCIILVHLMSGQVIIQVEDNDSMQYLFTHKLSLLI